MGFAVELKLSNRSVANDKHALSFYKHFNAIKIRFCLILEMLFRTVSLQPNYIFVRGTLASKHCAK